MTSVAYAWETEFLGTVGFECGSALAAANLDMRSVVRLSICYQEFPYLLRLLIVVYILPIKPRAQNAAMMYQKSRLMLIAVGVNRPAEAPSMDISIPPPISIFISMLAVCCVTLNQLTGYESRTKRYKRC